MADDVKVLIKAILEDKEFQKGLDRVNKASGKTAKKQTTLTKKMALGWKLFAGVITGVVVGGLTKLIKKASQAQEIFSKFDAVFSDVKKEADSMAQNLSDNFGLSTLKAKELLAGTGDLLTGFGFTQKAALDLSSSVNELSADLASFQNVPVEQASNAITKALLGEREALKGLGVAIIEADLIQLAKDMGQNFRAMTRVEKATLTYQAILKQTANAQGDFSRTAGSFANQVKILQNRFEDWAVTVGSNLLPLFAPLIMKLNEFLKPTKTLSQATTSLVTASSDYNEITKKLKDNVGNLTDAEKRNLEVRQALLKLKIVEELDNINSAYDRLNVSTRFQVSETVALEDKVKNLKSAISSNVKVLNGMSDAQIKYSSNVKATQVDVNGLTKTEENSSSLKALLTKQTIDLAQAQLELANNEDISAEAVFKFADAINEGILSEEVLIGLNDDFAQSIRDKLLVIDEEIAQREEKEARDIEIAEANVERAEAEKERLRAIGKEKKRLADAEKKADEKLLKDKEKNAKKLSKMNKFWGETKLKTDKFFADQRVVATRTALDSIATLTQSKNKTLFKIGKAAAIANATVSSAQAILKTMASVPYPFNIPLAVLQAAAGAVQVDKISNTQFMADGGIVQSAASGLQSQGSDTVPAMLTPGERVLSVSANRSFENLMSTLSLPPQGGGGNTSSESNSFEDNRSFSFNNENTDVDSFGSFVDEAELMNARMIKR